MDGSTINKLWDRVLHLPPIWTVLWVGLALLTVTLIVLMRTRWGQSRPLHKCAALSLLAHVLLGCFATTIHIVTGAAGTSEPPPIRVTMTDGADEVDQKNATQRAVEPKPWSPPALGAVQEPDLAKLERSPQPLAPIERAESESATEVPSELLSAKENSSPADVPDAADDVPPADTQTPTENRQVASAESIETRAAEQATSDPVEKLLAMPEVKRSPTTPLPTPSASRDQTLPTQDIPLPPLPPVADTAKSDPTDSTENESLASSGDKSNLVALPRTASPVAPDPSSQMVGDPGTNPSDRDMADSVGESSAKQAQAASFKGDRPGQPNVESRKPLPGVYRGRIGEDRQRLVKQRGGSGETEEAVRAALRWLAAAQNDDGHWDARRFGAGQERAAILGQDRRGAGARADTGISGLAVLAFLGAGHTHLDGAHQDTVRRGLEYLLRSQKSNGDLSGDASLFARMYCHAMAAFALSEAYAMTGDRRLKSAVEAAAGYCVAAQNPTSGGWRYEPYQPIRQADRGDTSQLGWQIMALKSAERAGVDVPSETWNRTRRFLQSVSSTRLSGLASYRPGSGPSRTMTAEALYCRRLIRADNDSRAQAGAVAYVLEELPGEGKPNLYYWYYATLSLFQSQGPEWAKWNDALTKTLLEGQQTAGDLAGSWSPDTMWGGYGGRVYSTAMGAMCLEVYYRYLPDERTVRRPIPVR